MEKIFLEKVKPFQPLMCIMCVKVLKRPNETFQKGYKSYDRRKILTGV